MLFGVNIQRIPATRTSSTTTVSAVGSDGGVDIDSRADHHNSIWLLEFYTSLLLASLCKTVSLILDG